MKATFYVDQVNKAVGRIKEAHALHILNTFECNVEWTARTAVIEDIALADDEITQEDYLLILACVARSQKQIERYIFESRTDEP